MHDKVGAEKRQQNVSTPKYHGADLQEHQEKRSETKRLRCTCSRGAKSEPSKKVTIAVTEVASLASPSDMPRIPASNSNNNGCKRQEMPQLTRGESYQSKELRFHCCSPKSPNRLKNNGNHNRLNRVKN